MKLDDKDRRILVVLQRAGRMSNVALARQVGLSQSNCLRRLKNLDKAGIIESYAAVVDKRRLGFTITAFVLVTLEKQPSDKADFHARVVDEPHIVECHAMSGTHDYLLKVVARDMEHFSALVMNGILKYPHVRDMQSSFSLREIKKLQGLPI